jgi:protein involved in ribonucleotide reduction
MDIAFRRVLASGEDSYGAAAGQAAASIGIRIGAVFLFERAGTQSDMDSRLSFMKKKPPKLSKNP